MLPLSLATQSRYRRRSTSAAWCGRKLLPCDRCLQMHLGLSGPVAHWKAQLRRATLAAFRLLEPDKSLGKRVGLENYTAVEESDIEYVNTPAQLGVVNAQTAWVGIRQTLDIVHKVRGIERVVP